MVKVDNCRIPCPYRILYDAGGAFSVGASCGSAFHFLRGLYKSPNGKRLVDGVRAARMNVTRVGGRFALWGGLASTLECAMVYVRQKDDPWNSVTAGAATGGFLAMRRGLGAACRSAMFGGVLFTALDVGVLVFDRAITENMPSMDDLTLPQNSNNPAFHPPTPEAEASSSQLK